MNQIKKQHILSAIEEIDENGIRNGRHSSTYDLIYEGKLYPPKLVISIANRFATGEELDSNTFAGGIGTEAFKLLERIGFKIVNKKNTPEPTNYKATYSVYLENLYKEKSGTKTSYIKAIEILSSILQYNIFEENNTLNLQELYNDLIKEQRNKGGKYFHLEAPSYGQNGFYSASIKTYIDFHKKTNTVIMENSNFNTPLNQILYGPPGTGKTYNTINKALSILESISEEELNTDGRDILKSRFEDYIKNGQIVFTTFHQSMSYEDFIEGIKPSINQDNDEDLKYEIKAGIFKNACANAAYICYKKYQKTERQTFTYTFDDLYDAFIEKIQDLLKEQTPPIYKTLTGKDVTVIEINSNDSIKARAKNSVANRKPAPLTKENLQKLYDKFSTIDEIKNLKQVRETVEISPRITEFYAVFRALKEFENQEFKPDEEMVEENIESNDSNEEEIIKKFNARVYTNAIKEFSKTADPVVLIIDEINRGNVSQIFGELITLIEEDKRLGKDEGLELMLPYSKTKFGVPSNLFIIGTMNTADRSVEALDTALRRRFSFTEVMPKPELLANILFKGFNLKEVLETINQRIELLLDRDHTIGHSYFIKVKNNDTKELTSVFQNCIIPLLQEYFYHDYEKIALILGSGFVKVKENKNIQFASFDGLGYPEIGKQFELIKKIINIENAVMLLLNKDEK